MNLRSWLRREPQPVRVIADTRTIQVPAGPRKWAELEETILSIGATKVEAVGADGSLLRVVNLETEESSSGGPAIGRSASGLSEMAQMAQIIAEASDRAAQRHADAYRLAFEENTKLVGLLAERLGSLESSWMRTLDQLAEARQQTQESGGEVQALIAAALAGQAQGGLVVPKAPIPIDKGKKAP